MRIIKLTDSNFKEVVAEAVFVLGQGGVIVYPTDTLYGLGANALDEPAVSKIFKIKKRPSHKPLPIIVKNILWAKELAFIYSREEKILNSVWPGLVTAILPKRNIIPGVLTSNQHSVGIRVPNHPFTDKLLGKFGYPLTSTSANIYGEQPSNKIGDIIKLFEAAEMKPDLIIDAGDLAPSEPSTILDLTTQEPKILRVGPSKPKELLKLLEV